MKKIVKLVWSAVLIVFLFGLGVLLADKYSLSSGIVRMHVVANSNRDEDQSLKIKVKDEIVAYLSKHMDDSWDADDAKDYLRSQLPYLTIMAENVLREHGSMEPVKVYLCRDEFGVRYYDTFALPAGIYDTLRINIGSAEGDNWWCVVFPALCAPESTAAFRETAVSAGYNEGLVSALSKDDGYEIRFFLIDCLGKLENLLNFS